ncbi:MAG: SDR family NAD(P)-dependent oxidoreductase [Lautropia sp.]
MNREFEGLSAIVTGGAAGIGLACAQLLASRGCQVACLDLKVDALAPPLEAIACDVGSDASVRAAIAQAAGRFGGIDIVINNAGIGALGDVASNDDAEWHRLFDINVLGVVRTTRAALPWLERSRHAAIVCTCSAVALTGLPNRALYSATKGAVLSLTRAMAADFIATPIRVNCVTPGVVDTPWQTRAVESSVDPQARRAELNGFQPSGRMASAIEVARAIAYLASPASGSTTGVDLPVDGGLQALRASASPASPAPRSGAGTSSGATTGTSRGAPTER